MNLFWIGFASGFAPLVAAMIFLRLAPKPDKRNLDDANDLLRERNAIGETTNIELSAINTALFEIRNQLKHLSGK